MTDLEASRRLAQLQADQLGRTVWLVRRRRAPAIEIAISTADLPADLLAMEAISPRLASRHGRSVRHRRG